MSSVWSQVSPGMRSCFSTDGGLGFDDDEPFAGRPNVSVLVSSLRKFAYNRFLRSRLGMRAEPRPEGSGPLTVQT